MKHVSEFIKEQKNLDRYTCFKWDEKSVKSFWDFEAAFDWRYFTSLRGPNIAGMFQARLRGKSRILDYGAGKGFLTEELLKHGFKVSCFDLSEATTRSLDAKFKSNANYLGSFSTDEIEANRGSFDAVFLIEVIEHLEDDARKTVLGQIHNLLAKDGVVIISTPNDENLGRELICNPRTNEVYHRWQHVYSWTGASLSAEVERHGFKTQAVIETDLKYEGLGAVWYMRGALKKFKARLKGHRQGNLLVVAAKP
jgi:2-polyprenyl-3-methyl-5-hydroxy-6-metoxy-1,4-benzoquinol methylase